MGSGADPVGNGLQAKAVLVEFVALRSLLLKCFVLGLIGEHLAGFTVYGKIESHGLSAIAEQVLRNDLDPGTAPIPMHPSRRTPRSWGGQPCW